MKFFVRILAGLFIFYSLQSCTATRRNKSISKKDPVAEAEIIPLPAKKIAESNKLIPRRNINTKNIKADSVVDFAETLIGTKYKYGSAIKENGFDCSGFVTYVFNHYKIAVPRVSKDFTNSGIPVPLNESKPGDLILFTGTDTTGWTVGHMGFITQNDNGKIKFIHSSSGRSTGVIISELSKYYATRLVKVIRVFND